MSVARSDRHVETARPSETVANVARRMSTSHVGSVVGILTLGDILRLPAEELRTVEGLIDAESPRREAGDGGTS